MKEYLRKNWKNILIVLLVLFSLNKCVQSCNRGSEVDNLTNKIETSDSTYKATISNLTNERDSLSHALDLANNKADALDKMNSTLTDVAKKETQIKVVHSK